MAKTNDLPVELPEKAKPVGLDIGAEFPYEHKFQDVMGSNMAYVDEGEGRPLLFLHGNPTSSYLWRNVMPHLTGGARCIAPDLIGMGKSEKPDLAYSYLDHRAYLFGLIEALELRDITLVVHDWGSALGFDYASNNPGNVRGIAFMEAIMPPIFPNPRPGSENPLFSMLRDPVTGPELMYDHNFFVEAVLPFAIWRQLSEVEMDHYRAPYLEREARKPTLAWPNQIPFADGPREVIEIVTNYGRWLKETETPLLYLYCDPGSINPIGLEDWLVANLKNLETHYLGAGYHFIQEDHPHGIGRAVADWLRRLD